MSFSLVSGERTLIHKPLATCCNFSSVLAVNTFTQVRQLLKLNSGGSDFAVYQTVALRCTQQQRSNPAPPQGVVDNICSFLGVFFPLSFALLFSVLNYCIK